ncbi:MAG TPA: cytochrome P450 [Ramlibacter sp.]|nr:cytochrome P450 [Ramlibacter sp.]
MEDNIQPLTRSPHPTMSHTIEKTPALGADPFSSESLRDPFRFQRELRDAGSVVRLEKYGIYAVGRFEETKAILSDHLRFTTTAGVGLSDIRDPGSWRVKNPLLEIDPPDHTAIRMVLLKYLSPAVVRGLASMFQKEAEVMVESLLDKGSVDGMRDVAEPYVCTVFPRTVGITVEREKVLQFGDLNFNANGPQNELYWASFRQVEPLLPWLEEKFQRHSMVPGGVGEQIYGAEAAGALPPGTALGLVRVLFRGGFDTTIAGIAAALEQLARNPQQWDALRANPTLAAAAFAEALRHASPAQVMFRTTRPGGVELGGQTLEGDVKIAAFIGAANRDPVRWASPDVFDITRQTAGHLAFGAGAHVCLGLMIARLEAESVLTALARRVARLELDGPVEHRLVNTLRTHAKLPLRVIPA